MPPGTGSAKRTPSGASPQIVGRKPPLSRRTDHPQQAVVGAPPPSRGARTSARPRDHRPARVAQRRERRLRRPQSGSAPRRRQRRSLSRSRRSKLPDHRRHRRRRTGSTLRDCHEGLPRCRQRRCRRAEPISSNSLGCSRGRRPFPGRRSERHRPRPGRLPDPPRSAHPTGSRQLTGRRHSTLHQLLPHRPR